METKQEISSISFQQVETAVKEQAKFVVDYLQVIAKLNGRNFLAAFEGKSNIIGINSSGRLFSDAKIYKPPEVTSESTAEQTTEKKPKEPPPPLTQEQIIQKEIQQGMDKFFEDETLDNYALMQLAAIQQVMNEGVKVFAKSFIEDFFYLIEQTPEWERFYQDRKNEFSETEFKFLMDKIKGAFAYKLMSTAMIGNRDVRKEILLQTFFVNYPDMDAPLKAYKQKTINEITLYKEKILQDIKLLKEPNSKDAKKENEKTLLDDIKQLRKNFDVTLQKSVFTSLGKNERTEFLFDEIAEVLIDIASELNKIENEDLLKQCQIELAKSILHIYSHHSPRNPVEPDKKGLDKKDLGKIEMAELDWSNPQKLSMIRLANFIVQRHLREHVQAKYPNVIPLFEEKVELDKQRRLEKYQPKSPQFFRSDELTEKKGTPNTEIKEEVTNSQTPDYEQKM